MLPVAWWKQSRVLAHNIYKISGFYSNSISGLAFSPRFHKVRAIFPRPHCSSKHPAERGSEGWGFPQCNSQKLHPSFRQRHFSLHRMYQSKSVFDYLLLFLLEFCSWFNDYVLRLREYQFVNNRWRQPKAQRVKTRDLS